jgi:hypothetical protein
MNDCRHGSALGHDFFFGSISRHWFLSSQLHYQLLVTASAVPSRRTGSAATLDRRWLVARS